MDNVFSRAAVMRRRLGTGEAPRLATVAATHTATTQAITKAAGQVQKPVPSRALATEHREATLLFIARVGYATVRQVARAVWGKADKSARMCAGRSLRWLSERNLLTRKRDGDTASCEYLYALTRAGVTTLNGLDVSLPGGKAHGRDWLRYAHSHRNACNDVFASLYASAELKEAKMKVYSELEIRAGTAPVCNLEYKSADGSRFSKIPDLLMVGPRDRVTWIEVENAYRNDRDLQKVLSMMRAEALTEKPRVNQFVFYITAKGAVRIGERLKNALKPEPGAALGSIAAADTRILREMLFVFAIDRDTLAEKVLVAPPHK
jgi:hypothetical protein